MTDSRLYYESHITVENEFVDNQFYAVRDFEHFKELMEPEWRVSRFEVDDVDGIAGQFFCSAKYKNLDQMRQEVKKAIGTLEDSGFNVLRAKIEDTVWDTKYGDSEEFLETEE